MGDRYWGDNLTILRERIDSESVDLIYLDPPFNSNRNYNVLFKESNRHESDAQIEALEADFYRSDSMAQAYPRIQIVTIGKLLKGTAAEASAALQPLSDGADREEAGSAGGAVPSRSVAPPGVRRGNDLAESRRIRHAEWRAAVTGIPSVIAIVGDITQVDTDAIVNAANNELWMGSGVAGAIKRAGGDEIERQAMRRGPIPVGGAVSTGAGRLPYRAVIHAAAMGVASDRAVPASAESVESATRAALECADRLGIVSLALPALGTGVGGLDLAVCARVMVTEAERHLARPGATVRRVVLVLHNENARQTFQEAIDQGGFVA